VLIGSVRWWAAAYKSPVSSSPSPLPPSAPILTPCHFSRAHPRAVVRSLFSNLRMPVRLIAADDWCPSSMRERRLLELEKEGLLRPRTSSS